MISNYNLKFKKKYPNFYYFVSFLKQYFRYFIPALRLPVSKKFKKFYKENSGAFELNKKNKNILFFSARQDPDQIIVSTILRWSLNLRGCNTYVIGCDQALKNSCNSGSSPKLNQWQCKSCYDFANKTYKETGTEINWLNSIIDKKDIDDAKLVVSNIEPANYKFFTYKGFHVGELVRVSIAHFLKTNTIDSNSFTEINIYKNWLESAIIQVNAFSRYLDNKKPDSIVMLNGLFSTERIMLEVARSKNIDVVTYEVGFRPQTFFFIRNSPTNMCNNIYWDEFKSLQLNEFQNLELNEYINTRNNGKGYLINYFPNIISDKEKIENLFGIDFNKKTFLLFPNITWDSTLYNCDILFDSMIDWINSTIEYFADKNDIQLLIRAHPAESTLENADRDPVVRLIQKKFNSLPSNVIIIPSDSDVSSYVLMDNSYCGLVYGSTTGIEMGLRGLPVIVAGKIYYRNLGVSIDPQTREEYFNQIEDFRTGKSTFNKSDAQEIWRRYAYFAIFRSALSLPQLDYLTTSNFPSVNFSKLNDLRPKSSIQLDIICDGILNQGRFININ